MPKKEEEVSVKDFLKLRDQTLKMDQILGTNGKILDQKIANSLKSLETKVNNNEKSLNKKIEDNIITLDKKIDIKFKTLNDKLTNDVKNIEEKLDSLNSEIEVIRNDFTLFQQKFMSQFKNQEKILLSIVNKFKETMEDNKNKFNTDIENLKGEQDTLRISFTVNEKKLLDTINLTVENQMKLAVRGKENEVLMKLWIDEFKSIISDFENLKKKQPKDFSLQISEIISTIEMFKERLKS